MSVSDQHCLELPGSRIFWFGVSGHFITPAKYLDGIMEGQRGPTSTEIFTCQIELFHQRGSLGASLGALFCILVEIVWTTSCFAQILLPFNGTGTIDICDVSFVHIGYNFPCFDTSRVTITHTSQVRRFSCGAGSPHPSATPRAPAHHHSFYDIPHHTPVQGLEHIRNHGGAHICFSMNTSTHASLPRIAQVKLNVVHCDLGMHSAGARCVTQG